MDTCGFPTPLRKMMKFGKSQSGMYMCMYTLLGTATRDRDILLPNVFLEDNVVLARHSSVVTRCRRHELCPKLYLILFPRSQKHTGLMYMPQRPTATCICNHRLI